MPAPLLLLPVALLAVGAVLAGAARRISPGSDRVAGAFFAWAALVVLVAIWVPQRNPLDLTVGELGAGIRLAIRLDAVSFAFGLFVVVPAALLLTFTRSPSPPLALLATAASLFTLEASGLILAAFGWGATLLTVAVLLQEGGEAKPMTTRIRDQAALLCLLWAGAAIYSRAGTDQYAAIPVSVLQPQIFALVALASLLASGIVPWKSWPAALWERLRPETAGPATALLFFTGFYFLVRMYEAGGGHYPGRPQPPRLPGRDTACRRRLRAPRAGPRHAARSRRGDRHPGRCFPPQRPAAAGRRGRAQRSRVGGDGGGGRSAPDGRVRQPAARRPGGAGGERGGRLHGPGGGRPVGRRA